MTTPAPALTAVLDELDELRATATPGPWTATSPRADGSAYIDQPLLARDDGPPWVGHASRSTDAALIVAAHAAVPKLTAALRAVLALHRPTPKYAGEDADVTACAVCFDDDEIPEDWPCRTYAAITTALEAS